MKNYSPIIIGAIVDMISIAGFVMVGQIDGSNIQKMFVLLFYVLGMGIVLWSISKIQSPKYIFKSCFLLAVIFITVFEILGSTIYPGLVHDTDLFSLKYLMKLSAITIILFIGYIAISFLFYAIHIKLNKLRISKGKNT